MKTYIVTKDTFIYNNAIIGGSSDNIIKRTPVIPVNKFSRIKSNSVVNRIIGGQTKQFAQIYNPSSVEYRFVPLDSLMEVSVATSSARSNANGLDLTNSEQLDEDFSNFRLFGIGKETEKQKENRERRKAFRKKVNEELKGKDKWKALLTMSQRYNPASALPRAGVVAGARVNIFGIAVRLYPAFLTPEEAKKKKISLDAIEPAKKAWQKVSVFWRNLGGNPESLKEALMRGYDKPVYKWTKSSKKRIAIAKESGFVGSDIYPTRLPMGDRLEDEIFNEPHENAYYTYNPKYEVPAFSQDGAVGGSVVYEDLYSNYDAGVPEAIIVAGIGLLGSIAGMIANAGAKKNPYEEGVSPQLTAQINEAVKQAEEISPEELKKIQDAVKSEQEEGLLPDEGKSDTILGMPKTAFWIGVGLITLVGGFFIYKKFIAKK